MEFLTVTIGCNTFNNKANKLPLNILNQICTYSTKVHNMYCIKKQYIFKNLKSVKNIKTFDFKISNNIDMLDLMYILLSIHY